MSPAMSSDRTDGSDVRPELEEEVPPEAAVPVASTLEDPSVSTGESVSVLDDGGELSAVETEGVVSAVVAGASSGAAGGVGSLGSSWPAFDLCWLGVESERPNSVAESLAAGLASESLTAGLASRAAWVESGTAFESGVESETALVSGFESDRTVGASAALGLSSTARTSLAVSRSASAGARSTAASSASGGLAALAISVTASRSAL